MKSLQLFLFLFTASGLTGIAAPAPAPKVAVAAFTFHTFSVFEAVERTAQAGAHYLETFTNQALSPTNPTKIYATSPAQRALLRAHLEYEVNPRNNLAEVKQCVEFLRQHLKPQ